MVTDPVCKMTFPLEKAAATYVYKQTTYYFCNIKCKEKFAADPEFYLQSDFAGECCCCAEAFEDDELKVQKNLRSLMGKFIVASAMTLITALLKYLPFIDSYSLNICQMVLIGFVVFGPGVFLLLRGIKSLKGFKFNMFTLISLGIASGYFYSVYALFFPETLPRSLFASSGDAQLHFVPAGMIAALVILGQYLEARSSCGATQAVRSLMSLVPATAHRIKKCCGTVSDVPVSDVQVGDLLKVLPHEQFPVDGKIVEGGGSADESMLTGEALPVEKNPGNMVFAGSINGNTILLISAVKTGNDTLLAKIVDLVKSARKNKLPIQKTADKVSAVFVPLVLFCAVGSLLCWGLVAENWQMGITCFIAVLLAACPCSLGLAAPLAVTVGVGAGAKNGILIKDPAVLEDLRKMDTVMLDKTGTLTENILQVDQIFLDDDYSERQFFRLLLTLEGNSNHPLAQAIKNMKNVSDYLNDLPEAEDFTSLPGQGVSAIIDDLKYFLGSVDFIKKSNIDMESFARRHNIQYEQLPGSVMVLAAAGKVIGMVTFADRIRCNAAVAVCEIKEYGLDPVVISGDSYQAVKRCAETLDIGEFYAQLSPQEKLEKIKARKSFGRFVIMIGDGVNDAAALAAADVGIAMQGGTDAALSNAKITFLAGDIGKLGTLLKLSRAVNQTIKLNLMLAFAYNALLIPLAAGVFYTLLNWQFTPVCSSIAMSGSCLLVVFNSLKLWKLDLGKKTAENI